MFLGTFYFKSWGLRKDKKMIFGGLVLGCIEASKCSFYSKFFRSARFA